MDSSRPGAVRWTRVGAAAAALALLATLLGPPPAVPAEQADLRLSVLSNRADLISGGDALVRVTIPAWLAPSKVRVTAGDRDMTGAFAMRANGHLEGLITGRR